MGGGRGALRARHDGQRRTLISQSEPLWQRNSTTVEAFQTLRQQPNLESLPLDGVNWSSTPGYTGFLRDVPMRLLLQGEESSDFASGYTHVLTTKISDRMPGDHDLIRSWPVRENLTLHLFRYADSYDGRLDTDINDQIEAQWHLFRAGTTDVIAP